MPRITGGEALVRCLLNEGVRWVFGIPGGQLLPVIDAIARLGNARGIDFVMTRHEAAAGNMADAWARVSGRVGVCMGTVGPGAANLTAAAWVAHADNVPLLIITPQVHSLRAYPFRGSQQQLDHLKLFAPITKWNAVVGRWERIPELVRRAFRLALSGRPGPVHLDIPADVIYEKREEDELDLEAPELTRAVRGPGAPPDQARRIVNELISAERPLIHAGSGVLRAGAEKPLRRLAEQLLIPVSSTGAARGVLPEDHPMALVAKRAGANHAQARADVVLGLGCAFWERDAWGRPPVWGPPGEQSLIHVDIDPAAIGLNRPVDIAVPADAREVLVQLLEAIRALGPVGRSSSWADLCKGKEMESGEALEPMLTHQGHPIHPLRLVGEVWRFFGPEAVYVVDGGNMAVWANMGILIGGPRRFMFPMHSGHLGVGLPFGLGAKLAEPDRPVVIIHGDGSFMLSCHEAETAARLGIKVIDIIGNDRCWAMVKAGQDADFEGRHCGVDLTDTRYDLLARAMGCHGERITDPKEIRLGLERAMNSGLPAVLDVIINPEVNLNPPPLKAMADAWLEGCER